RVLLQEDLEFNLEKKTHHTTLLCLQKIDWIILFALSAVNKATLPIDVRKDNLHFWPRIHNRNQPKAFNPLLEWDAWKGILVIDISFSFGQRPNQIISTRACKGSLAGP
ncbi:unnamed protein product, partial [Meganyctiphanes norvegica]